FDLRRLGVADPLDVPLTHGSLQHALGVTDTAQPEVADVGFGCHVGHGHAVADLAPAQIGVHDHRELVGGAEARSALYRTDHDSSRVLHKLVPGLLGGFGVADMADRLCVSAVRSQALHLVE